MYLFLLAAFIRSLNSQVKLDFLPLTERKPDDSSPEEKKTRPGIWRAIVPLNSRNVVPIWNIYLFIRIRQMLE